jgi:hypothetical protein
VRLSIDDPSFTGRTIFLAYQRASAVYESVQALARIARVHGGDSARSLRQMK